MPRGRTHLFIRFLAIVLLGCATLLLTTAGDWPTYLHDASRSGAADAGASGIGPGNAGQLGVAWTFKTGGTIAASPTVVNGTVYVGSWDGWEYALDATTGALKWKTYLGLTSSTAPHCVPSTGTIGVTSSATVQNGVVYVGGNDTAGNTGKSYWYALDATTGNVLWKIYTGDNSQKGGHYNWSSPLIYNGDAYIGIASLCDNPLVQGQLVQVDLNTHQIVHTFIFVPNGQVGGGIWTSPSIDPATNTIYVTTGTNGRTYSSQPYTLAMVALDASTLALKGSWQVPPAQQTTDSDWGTSPLLLTDEHGNQLVAGLNKGGYLYAFNRANIGAGPVWSQVIAAGGPAPTNGDGSVSSAAFGPASTGQNLLYMAGGNTTIGTTPYSGSVRALDPATGNIVWEQGTAHPVIPALAYADGLVIDGAGGRLEVRDAASGNVLYYDQTPVGWFYSAPSVAEGHIYIGDNSGTIYAFAVAPNIPTATPTYAAPPTATPAAPTATVAPPTATSTQPTATTAPPTATPAPPTATPPIVSPTPTWTSAPPAPTPTWTSVPPPPTATTAPPPPSATTAPPPAPTPTRAAAPPPATQIPAPPPATQAPAPAATPAPTPTPTSAPPGSSGGHHGGAHHAALPLTLTVDPLRVRSGATLTLRAHTKPHGSLAISLTVTRSVTTWTGHGRQRKQHKQTHVLYKLTARGQAGAKGLSVVHLRVGYRVTRQIGAALLVTAQISRVRATRTVQITILPPQVHARPRAQVHARPHGTTARPAHA